MSGPQRLSAFQACRGDLVALAYRMLGDIGRAEDMVQEAWLRWERQEEAPASPKAFLVTIVTRLCLNELDSARARREESRADRLPEPVNLEAGGLSRVERLEEVSMAFLVMLQRLSPAERAVLLLHEVFDFEHQEIAGLVGTTVPSSRKLLERARKHVAAERRLLVTPPDEHRRLLQAFMGAASAGNVEGLVALLADDAVMVSDGGPEGRAIGGQRNLAHPLEGAARVAAFVAAASTRGRVTLRREVRVLNGQPAVVFRRDGAIVAALTLAVGEGKIQRVFFHADPDRLGHIEP